VFLAYLLTSVQYLFREHRRFHPNKDPSALFIPDGRGRGHWVVKMRGNWVFVARDAIGCSRYEQDMGGLLD